MAVYYGGIRLDWRNSVDPLVNFSDLWIYTLKHGLDNQRIPVSCVGFLSLYSHGS